MNNTSRTIVAGLALWTATVFAEGPEVTPYRPTVSSPATLSAPGLLELEAGVARSHDDSGIHLFSVPYLFKYAFTENFGVLLGGDAFLHADGNDLTGIGDTVAEIKLRHELTDNMALGLETGVHFPTAKSGLGAGKSQYIVNGIFSASAGRLNFDVNLGYIQLGSIGPEEGHGQIDWASAISGKLGGPWGCAAELSGRGQRGKSGATQALAALSYQPSRTLVFDFGLSHDLNSHTNETTLFAGFVILFAHH